MNALVWIALGLAGAIGICAIGVIGCLPRWIANAEVGLDPFADLPTFDDDEAQQLLEQGA